MSVSQAESVTSGGEETDSISDGIPDNERSLAQRMILHVYNRFGLVEARQLPFWEAFRQANPDVELPARELRNMFFGEVLLEQEHCDDLPSVVAQYLNPQFNHFQLEALEAGDLREQEDFVFNVPARESEAAAGAGMTFEQMAEYIGTPFPVTHNVPAVPLQVRLVAAPPVRETIPEEESNLAEQFARVLSELVWTREEAPDQPVLSMEEIRERVMVLTGAGISLGDMILPGMESYELARSPTQTESTPAPAAVAVDKQDQLVPTMPSPGRPIQARVGQSAKRWASFDDSGLGLSPSKRSRLLTPSTRKHPRLRRIFSAPNTPYT